MPAYRAASQPEIARTQIAWGQAISHGKLTEFGVESRIEEEDYLQGFAASEVVVTIPESL